MLSRRNLLAGGAMASAAIAVSTHAVGKPGIQIIVFDSRDARSQTFAAAGHGENIDVAQNPVSLWSALRTVQPKALVRGFTRWSDFIAVRGNLERAGLRVRHFKQQGKLIDWAMG
jgi:hypothetical protein